VEVDSVIILGQTVRCFVIMRDIPSAKPHSRLKREGEEGLQLLDDNLPDSAV